MVPAKSSSLKHSCSETIRGPHCLQGREQRLRMFESLDPTCLLHGMTSLPHPPIHALCSKLTPRSNCPHPGRPFHHLPKEYALGPGGLSSSPHSANSRLGELGQLFKLSVPRIFCKLNIIKTTVIPTYHLSS